jgi:hypothetical protein
VLQRLVGGDPRAYVLATVALALVVSVVFLRTIGFDLRRSPRVAVESVALRQQLATLKRSVKRPQLRARDRAFWILLAKVWRDWRRALLHRPARHVVRWHREWLRRWWTARSRPSHAGGSDS